MIDRVGLPITQTGSNTNSISQSFTVQSGFNRILIVEASYRSSFPGNTGIVASVTFDGTALTLLTEVTNVGFISDVYTSIFYLVLPEVKTGNIVVTYTGTVQTASFIAQEYDNVDPVAPFTATNAAVGFGTSSNVDVASSSDELVIDSHAHGLSNTWIPGIDQTTVATISFSLLFHGFSDKDGESPTTTMTWSGSIRRWVHVAGSMQETASSSSSSSLSSSSSSSRSSSSSSSSSSSRSSSSSSSSSRSSRSSSSSSSSAGAVRQVQVAQDHLQAQVVAVQAHDQVAVAQVSPVRQAAVAAQVLNLLQAVAVQVAQVSPVRQAAVAAQVLNLLQAQAVQVAQVSPVRQAAVAQVYHQVQVAVDHLLAARVHHGVQEAQVVRVHLADRLAAQVAHQVLEVVPQAHH